MQVVDAHTAKGVPGIKVTTDNGIVCYTDFAGNVRWNERSLMNRVVTFRIGDQSFSWKVAHARHAIVAVR
jgi:hypothetical protein